MGYLSVVAINHDVLTMPVANPQCVTSHGPKGGSPVVVDPVYPPLLHG